MSVTVIVQAIVDSIMGLLQGIGGGITDFFETIFTKTVGETTTLSTFAVVAIAMLGVGLAFGLVRLLMNKIRG